MLGHVSAVWSHFSILGLFVAPAVDSAWHTVVSLCGLSQEFLERCQRNVHVHVWNTLLLQQKCGQMSVSGCTLTKDVIKHLKWAGTERMNLAPALAPEKWPEVFSADKFSDENRCLCAFMRFRFVSFQHGTLVLWYCLTASGFVPTCESPGIAFNAKASLESIFFYVGAEFVSGHH